jgi:fructokinase
MSYTVVGIGELLWDQLPQGRRVGGAPVNFACHCSQLGAVGIPVSCVGHDRAGQDLARAVQVLGLDAGYLQVHPTAPTGSVQVELDDDGVPRYRVRENVAWDYIRIEENLVQLAGRVDAVCFGTLAQRGDCTRRAIQSFVGLCPERALKIFDVNLRQAFYGVGVIAASLELATVLKVSDNELPVLAVQFDLKGSPVEQLMRLITLFDLELVAYTRGSEGSILVAADEVVEHPGCKPRIVDTVGAGDSYTAALCMGLLAGMSIQEVIGCASRVSAFVCEQPGATPVLPESFRLAMMGA